MRSWELEVKSGERSGVGSRGVVFKTRDAWRSYFSSNVACLLTGGKIDGARGKGGRTAEAESCGRDHSVGASPRSAVMCRGGGFAVTPTRLPVAGHTGRIFALTGLFFGSEHLAKLGGPLGEVGMGRMATG